MARVGNVGESGEQTPNRNAIRSLFPVPPFPDSSSGSGCVDAEYAVLEFCPDVVWVPPLREMNHPKHRAALKLTRVNGVIASMFVADFSSNQKILRSSFDLNVAGTFSFFFLKPRYGSTSTAEFPAA